jgi:hypothetical protein
VHDAAELAAVLPDGPGKVYADSAFSGRKAEATIRAPVSSPMIRSGWSDSRGGVLDVDVVEPASVRPEQAALPE